MSLEISDVRRCGRTQLTLDMVRRYVEQRPHANERFVIVVFDLPDAERVKGLIDAMGLKAEAKIEVSSDFGRDDPTFEPCYSVLVKRIL